MKLNNKKTDNITVIKLFLHALIYILMHFNRYADNMRSIGEVLQVISICLAIANFLLSTCRVQKAIEVCKECVVVILNNNAVITEEVIQIACKGLYWTMLEAHCLINDYTSAIKYGKKLLVIVHKLGEKVNESKISLKLAVLHQQQSKHEEARKLCEKALAINEEVGDRVLKASCYGHLGVLFQSRAEYAKAQNYLEKSLAIRREMGDRNGESSCYGNLGNLFCSLGEYSKANDYLKKAAVIKREIGDKCGEASSYGNLGSMSW